jgi:hypothetical protein
LEGNVPHSCDGVENRDFSKATQPPVEVKKCRARVFRVRNNSQVVPLTAGGGGSGGG